jgi:transcriptional regulator with XRE-family HTH domain
MASTADLVRVARRTAGFTQRELATHAGTSAAAINRYERNRTIPDLRTLQRVLAACGFELELGMTRRTADGEPDVARDQAERDREAIGAALAAEARPGWVRTGAPARSR